MLHYHTIMVTMFAFTGSNYLALFTFLSNRETKKVNIKEDEKEESGPNEPGISS